MDKRSLIAIVLSILILIVFQYYYASQAPQKMPEEPRQEEKAPVPVPPAPEETTVAPPSPVSAAQVRESAPEEIITVDTDLYTAEFSSIGGTVKSWLLKQYKDNEGLDVSILKEGSPFRALGIGWNRDLGLSDVNFKVIGRDIRLSGADNKGSLAFEYATDQYTVRRTYTFFSDKYYFNVVDEVKGLPEYFITLGSNFGIYDWKSSRLTHTGPLLLEDMDRVEVDTGKLKETRIYTGAVKWIAIEDKYFMASIVPRNAMDEAVAWKYQDSAAIAFKGKPGTNEFLVYAGPKEHDRLKDLGVDLEYAVDFGFFSIIARPIFWLLKQFYHMVGNYGWAIIILTIVIRIPFIPIVHKGQKSMKRLQEVQPRMQQIREQFKNDPQQMQREMMALYKKHKVNPMGGCLPMLLQIPVFFALYKVLLIAIELRGAPFMLWITDLSAKDPYYILPIVMGVSMLLQQKMTPTAGDPKQQKIMMFMPVIFTFLFLNFASGLVLYWLVNNLLSIGQQIYINRKKS